MCVTDGVLTIWKFNTYVLEADEMTGPWRMVAYLNTRFKSSPDLRPR